MYKIFKKSLSLLTKKNRTFLFLIFIGNQIGSILEVLSLGALPFIAINLIDNSNLLIFLEKKNLTFISTYIENENFVIYSFLFLILFFILKNLYLMLMNYLQTLLRVKIFNDISINFFNLYIYSPYKYFLKKSPSYLSSIMINEIQGACNIIELFVLLLRDIFTVLVICVTLILIDPKISSLLVIFIIIVVLLFYRLFKKFLYIRGKILQEARADNLKVIYQSFDIIKEAKILKKENFFIKLFNNQLLLIAKQKIVNSIISMLPRPFLEVLILIVITMIIYYSTYITNSLDTAVPYIAFLATSSIRLIPAFKSISNSLSNINFQKISIDVVLNEVEQIEKYKSEFSFINKKDKNNKINEKFNKIEIKNLSFSYDDKNEVLQNISLKISKGQKIGIIGSSGSGKSTLVNIILGLLKPNKGDILIDDKSIFNNLNNWYDFIGYIPQEIYLLNDTIKNNIALGVNEENIDLKLVDNALKFSNSTQFVENLPKKIETNVGNRGISFSGGQKQRIGIARAFYKKSKILILDEATNSLDFKNESEIINHIMSLEDITTFIIAHNLHALKKCDKIIYLDRGNLKDFDTFEKITEKYKLI